MFPQSLIGNVLIWTCQARSPSSHCSPVPTCSSRWSQAKNMRAATSASSASTAPLELRLPSIMSFTRDYLTYNSTDAVAGEKDEGADISEQRFHCTIGVSISNFDFVRT